VCWPGIVGRVIGSEVTHRRTEHGWGDIGPAGAYAGFAAAADVEARAQLAVDDGQRWRFERSRLLVATTTGRGGPYADSSAALE